jgi:hypothetical protein
MTTRTTAAKPTALRFGIITWMLVIATLALPMHALRIAGVSRKAEDWAVACVASVMGAVGLASAVAASRRGGDRAIIATWCVVFFQALGVSVPDPFGILLMPLGLVAGTSLHLWLTGHLHT